MAWFEKEMDYARQSLEKLSSAAIDQASEQLNTIVRDGITQASGELQQVVMDASREVDAKLDKISEELHNQRHFTKTDVKELVDYAAAKLGDAMDERIHHARSEMTTLVEEKVDYLKNEIDSFFIRRQEDLARERRRLVVNILIAVGASLLMGVLSLMYHRATRGVVDMFELFRVLFLSLTAGYAIFLVINVIRRYRQTAEHKKDLGYLALKYSGVLSAESIFGHVLLLVVILLLSALLLFPDTVLHWIGNEDLIKWFSELRGH